MIRKSAKIENPLFVHANKTSIVQNICKCTKYQQICKKWKIHKNMQICNNLYMGIRKKHKKYGMCKNLLIRKKINESVKNLKIHKKCKFISKPGFPPCSFRGVKIMLNVFTASNCNVYFKNENISENLPCRNNSECFHGACFALPIKTAGREPRFPDENR